LHPDVVMYHQHAGPHWHPHKVAAVRRFELSELGSRVENEMRLENENDGGYRLFNVRARFPRGPRSYLRYEQLTIGDS
jgi:hypothetical protein